MNVKYPTPGKYAFVGAASTGKTTLLDALKQDFATQPDVVFIDESGRVYFQEHPTPPELVFSVSVQTEIQQIILAKEQAAAQNKPSIIFCDRSVLDSPVHLYAMGDTEGAEVLLKNAEFWLSTYSMFFLLDPTDVPYKKDDVRTESEDTRNLIHKTFISFLERNNISYQLLSGTLEERIARIKEILKQDLVH